MDHQIELGYLVLEVPDPDILTPVFADVVGLVARRAAADGALTWRNDDRAHRIIVQPGPANDAVAVGFEAVDARGVRRDRRTAARDRRRRRRGHATSRPRPGRPAGSHRDAVGRRCRDRPRTRRRRAPFSSPLVPGGFLTDGVGFGHAVFATMAFDESDRFLTDGLGLAQSDWLETELAPGIALEVRFYHCNARHHTLALARAPFDLPQRLHHVMFEANTRDDVGAAFDRAWATDCRSRTGSAATTTTACSASTCRPRPASRSSSATARA